MAALLAPRPFSTFELLPFLFVDSNDIAEIQKAYFKLSRKYHPDLAQNLSEDARNIQEATSARLNSDYALLKDFWKLLDSVVHGAKIPQASKGAALPPTLAGEYFELQDLWQEKGRDAPEARQIERDLVAQLRKELDGAESAVVLFAKRFPFKGFGNAAAPWSEKDLVELSTLLQKLRYLKAFTVDLESKKGPL